MLDAFKTVYQSVLWIGAAAIVGCLIVKRRVNRKS